MIFPTKTKQKPIEPSKTFGAFLHIKSQKQHS